MNKPARFDGEYLYYYLNSSGDVSLISPGLQDEDGISPFEQIYYYFRDSSDGIYSSGVGTGTTRFRNGASVTLPRAIWERITYPDNLVVEIIFTDQKGNQEVLNSKGILSVEESSTGDPYSYDYVTPNQCVCELIFQNEHAGALLQEPNSDLSNPDNEPKYFDHLFVPVEFTTINISDSDTWGKYLKKVTLPTTIREIVSLRSLVLQEVNFPKGLETIHSSAFENMGSLIDKTGLTYVSLPDTLKKIGSSAFYGNSIEYLAIPDSVDQIGDGAFAHNPIETLYLPNSLERINSGAFLETEITFLSIPKSVKSIGRSAFYNSPLTYLELPYGLEEVGPSSFWGNRLSGQIILPQTIESIGEYAFNTLGWGSLTSVIVPPNISIGERAFDLGVKIIEGEYPISIEFSSTGLDENINPGSVIAELYSSDITIGDQHQYSLIKGEGDEHNNEFTVENNQLIIVDSPDFETQDSYSIRLQTKDFSGLTFEQSFILSVNDLNDVPTDLSVSASTFDENISSGSSVTTLSTADPDADDTHTYSLVSGDGDTDNSAFTIDGDQLKIIESPNYETQESYSIRFQTTDSGGLTFEKAFNLSVNDVEEGPLDLDGDGFVDEVTNYQMWTESGGVDLTNRRGGNFSDNTSRIWNAEKAIQTDTGFSILIKHESKESKYKIWTTDSDGIVNSMSKWQSGDQMMADGLGDLFDLDLNGDSTPYFGLDISSLNNEEIIDSVWGPGSNGIDIGGSRSYGEYAGGGLNYSTDPCCGWSKTIDGIYTTGFSLLSDGTWHDGKNTFVSDPFESYYMSSDGNPNFQYLTIPDFNNIITVDLPDGAYGVVFDLEDFSVAGFNYGTNSNSIAFKPKPFTRYGGFAWYEDNRKADLVIRAISDPRIPSDGFPPNTAPYTDLDLDGFVDEVIIYQMYTPQGAVDLKNRRGTVYSDETSKIWNAENAMQTDSGFSILIKHERKGSRYKILTTDSDGVVNSMSKWQSGDQMMTDGFEDLFDLDLNGDSIIGKPPIQDIDDDGFVDGATEYQVFTTDARELYLRNKNGRKIFSNDTSRQWDAIKAVATDSSIQTLIEGTARKEGKYKIWTSSQSSGNLMSQTRWVTGDALTSEGYESLFNYDINDNGVIGA